MAKRRVRVKLSKTQILENDRNKWSAKKEAAIELLIKAMDNLRDVERRQRRLDKVVPSRHEAVRVAESEENFQAAVDAIVKEHVNVSPVTTERELAEFVAGEQALKSQRKASRVMEGAPQAGKPDRAARMKAMGFRPTKRRREKAQTAATG